MSSWLNILLFGMIALVAVFFFGRGIPRMLEESRQAVNPDWKGAIIPLALVVLFVILLIAAAAS